MAYEISPYDEEATIFEVLNDSIPEFYGTEEECQAYIDNMAQ